VTFYPVFADAPEGEATTGQDPAAQPQGQQQPQGLFGGGIMAYAPFILLGLFFLVVLLPAQRRQKREAAARLAAMKPGAKVVLNSGIVGKIVTMKEGEDEIVIKSDDTKLRVLKTAVATVVSDETPAATAEVKS
jgi:preprotein translocase subunit YajC